MTSHLPEMDLTIRPTTITNSSSKLRSFQMNNIPNSRISAARHPGGAHGTNSGNQGYAGKYKFQLCLSEFKQRYRNMNGVHSVNALSFFTTIFDRCLNTKENFVVAQAFIRIWPLMSKTLGRCYCQA